MTDDDLLSIELLVTDDDLLSIEQLVTDDDALILILSTGHSVGELHPTPGVKSLLSLQREQGSRDLHSSTYCSSS